MKAENIGGNFDDFLQEERSLDEANALAINRVIAWQIDREMNAQKLAKSAMAIKCTPAEQPCTVCSTMPLPA